MRHKLLVLSCLCIIITVITSSCNRTHLEQSTSTISATVRSITTPVTPTPKPVEETPDTGLLATLEAIPGRFAPAATPTETQAVGALPMEEAQKKLRELIENNGNCKLPCVWGLTAGESPYQEGLDLLAPLGNITSIIRSSENSIATGMHYLQDDLTIVINLSFSKEANSDTITHITFIARALNEAIDDPNLMNVYDSNTFGEAIKNYSLPGLLSAFGRPNSALLWVAGGVEYRYFRLILVYPDQGTVVTYTTRPRIDGENIVGCISNAHVEFNIYPKSSYFLVNFGDVLKAQDASYKDLQAVTSLSMDDFYKSFRQSPDKCIETPLYLWPKFDN